MSGDCRVTKPTSKKSVRKHKVVTSSAASSSTSVTPYQVDQQQHRQHVHTNENDGHGSLSSASNFDSRRACSAQSRNTHNSSLDTGLDDRLSCSKKTHYESADDEFSDNLFDDVFDSINFDDFDHPAIGTTNTEAQSTAIPRTTMAAGSSTYPSICTDGDALPSLLDLTDDFSSPFQLEFESDHDDRGPTINCKQSSDAVNTTSSNSASKAIGKFRSPATPKAETLIPKKSNCLRVDRNPVARAPFPSLVKDRSPIIGLSSKSALRTCFRIGEAINQASHATNSGQDFMFELYAKVLSTNRDASKQHFVFADLFHERPPHLKGEYDAAIWKGVELFNYDSGRFLRSKSSMCRCIGMIKRNKNREWVMIVLNIWEATWKDVEWVEGIVNA